MNNNLNDSDSAYRELYYDMIIKEIVDTNIPFLSTDMNLCSYNNIIILNILAINLCISYNQSYVCRQ